MNTPSNEVRYRAKLSPEAYAVCREGVTEPAYSGKYVTLKDDGTYSCAGCGQILFSSEAKYDSGSGWPSFFTPLAEDRIKEKEDISHGMRRVEVLCTKCDSHLGHVFPDGPNPTGLRYCVNSLSLEFKKSD